MYKVKDKVVYQMNGACIILDLEEKKIKNEIIKFYKLEDVMTKAIYYVPINDDMNEKLRYIVDKELIEQVLQILSIDTVDTKEHWNIQIRNNTNDLRSGDIYKESLVLNKLAKKNLTKGLSISEKETYNRAYKLLIGEFMLALDTTESESRRLINDALGISGMNIGI